MPLLDIEKQLFVCKDQEGTIQITVKNAGNDPLKLRDVFPIGECRDYVHINFNNQAIKPNDTTDIEVAIDDYWKPVEIQIDTNCPRTGKIIYVLRPENPQGPNLWLFPDEKYNRDQVFFHDPEPRLQLPIVVQSNSNNPLEIDFCSIKLVDEDTNENSLAQLKIAVYCGETGREINRQGNELRYQIVNTQGDYQVHSACIYFSRDVLQDGYVGQAIELEICTNSYLTKLREQKISIQLTKLEVTPIVKGNRWLRLKKKKKIELEIKNSGPHPLRIFSIPADPNKVEVKDIETDNERTEVSYPIVIQENETKKLGIVIKSTLKEWLWSGIDLSNVSIPICANTVSDPQSYKVSPCETKLQSTRIFWIPLAASTIFLTAIALSLFLREQEQDVIISSYPHGKTVYIDRKPVGTTPTWLKVKEKAIIQIGDSPEYSVKKVLEDGLIFYREKKKEEQDEQ